MRIKVVCTTTEHPIQENLKIKITYFLSNAEEERELILLPPRLHTDPTAAGTSTAIVLVAT